MAQPKQPYAEVLAQRRPWKLGTVLAWVIWRKVECLDRITNYSQWDWYGSHALDAWRQVLSKIQDGQLVPVEQGRPQGRHEWFDVLDTEAGAEIAFNRMITFDREEVQGLWRSREETEKNPVDVGEKEAFQLKVETTPVPVLSGKALDNVIRAAAHKVIGVRSEQGGKLLNIVEMRTEIMKALRADGIKSKFGRLQERVTRILQEEEFKKHRGEQGVRITP